MRSLDYKLHSCATVVQSDGSLTMTEPSVILTGQPEGQQDVSLMLIELHPDVQYARSLSATSVFLQVVVRVHDACFTSGTASTHVLNLCFALHHAV